jgi:hypothetical protein
MSESPRSRAAINSLQRSGSSFANNWIDGPHNCHSGNCSSQTSETRVTEGEDGVEDEDVDILSESSGGAVV